MMVTKKIAAGFTLIELMFVVAILGIVAAAAITTYQNYVLKSQVNRAVGELSAYQTPFEVQASESGPVANSDLGYSPSSITTGNVATSIAVMNVDGSGHIQVTMGGSAHPNLSGVIIRFERNVAGIWRCVIDSGAASGWNNKFGPEACTVI